MKNKFLRTCVGCFCKKKKENLLRISKNKNDEISFDKEGRGVYICKSSVCFEKAMKRKKDGFSYCLKKKVSREFLDFVRISVKNGESDNLKKT